MKQAVLGIGNLLLGDEGIGVHIAQQLQQELSGFPVEVYDIGTAILDCVPIFEEASRILIIDAMKAGHKPGTIYRILLKDCMKASNIGSLHGFDLAGIQALTQREDMPQIVVIGIEPQIITWSLNLSPRLKKKIPDIIAIIKKEIGIKGGTLCLA